MSELVARYRAEGDAAFEPRSRRPKTSPTAIADATVELIVELRRQLTAQGSMPAPTRSAGTSSTTTSSRCRERRSTAPCAASGLVTPAPAKRPRSSYVRFQAEQPNEMWQADFTHYRLTTGVDVEILSWLDDHARHALSVTAHRRVTGPIVVDTFRAAIAQHGPPASTLTDNGMVFTTRLAGGHGGRNGFETELRRSASPRRTLDPTTPPPAARSNASNRR